MGDQAYRKAGEIVEDFETFSNEPVTATVDTSKLGAAATTTPDWAKGVVSAEAHPEAIDRGAEPAKRQPWGAEALSIGIAEALERVRECEDRIKEFGVETNPAFAPLFEARKNLEECLKQTERITKTSDAVRPTEISKGR